MISAKFCIGMVNLKAIGDEKFCQLPPAPPLGRLVSVLGSSGWILSCDSSFESGEQAEVVTSESQTDFRFVISVKFCIGMVNLKAIGDEKLCQLPPSSEELGGG